MTLVRRDIWSLGTPTDPWHPTVLAYARGTVDSLSAAIGRLKNQVDGDRQQEKLEASGKRAQQAARSAQLSHRPQGRPAGSGS